jgi:misacylated tRNA(Ala) deacylase
MTELLYLLDSYQREFEASVTAVDPTTQAVFLSHSAFYPGGGGQQPDAGQLLGAEGQVYRVLSAEKVEGQVAHLLEGDSLPAVGQTVQGHLDWERRYQAMRTHSAMHILCGVIWRDYQMSVTGGEMGLLEGRMDFEFPQLTQETIAEIEQKINDEVAAAREIRVQVLPREVAFQIPDLIRTKINLLPPGIAEVRTVEIVGLDLQADGGTHVANTREVGTIRITKYKSKGGANKRLYVELS